ncbi:MAG: DUF255 domain-containing protein [Chlorobi bacterium]|nr:DUF255 domain-containing protein [Chlorobiota bacterium]
MGWKITKVVTLLLITAFSSHAQIFDPVDWKVEVKHLGKTAELHLYGSIEPGWHIYGTEAKEGGPQATTIEIEELRDAKVSKQLHFLTETYTKYDPYFEMDVTHADDTAHIKITFDITGENPFLKGTFVYMACDTANCLPPEYITLELPLNKDTSFSLDDIAEEPTVSVQGIDEEDEPIDLDQPEINAQSESPKDSMSLWAIFVAGFIGGLLALLTPCVFPMIPLTVSYFTKREGGKKGIIEAVVYGLAIIIIYVSLGVIVTKLFGADVMNKMASSAFLNLLFFFLFVIFAISFFGAFEIRLPSSWATATDQLASKTGGVIGIFFMAFTLAIVSFSCTGPIIGTLLVQAALSGETWGPTMGMLGFAVALALPFTFFAMFPGVLQSLPRSGMWMNTVKVSLGFIELALALKFLSNVDLAYRWGILNREIFLSIWIVIFATWGMFLLGIVKIKNTDGGPIGIGRLLLGMLVMGFAIYMLPGLWGAPLKVLSGLAPPDFYKEWKHQEDLLMKIQTKITSYKFKPAETKNTDEITNYPHPESCAQNLPCYHDFEDALLASKATGKPILIDFTGWTCVNCRKMEEHVWSDKEIWKMLAEDYILASLYVDERTDLPPEKQYRSERTGKLITTIGERWTDMQISMFGSNSQPFYVVIAPDSTVLVPPRGYTPNVSEFKAFLEEGLRKWEEHVGFQTKEEKFAEESVEAASISNGSQENLDFSW